jgi:hypothetical protein
MANGDSNTGQRVNWMPFILSVVLVIVSAAVQYGITSATLVEHSRRLEQIEKRQEDNYLSRTEYERRHDDLIRRVSEQEARIRELERKGR